MDHNRLRNAMADRSIIEVPVWGMQPGMTRPDWIVSMINFRYVGLAVPTQDPSLPVVQVMPPAGPGMAAEDDKDFEEVVANVAKNA